MSDTLRIARKEFDAFFASPAAFLFLGAFLATILFVFFWVETFFARNIADVRPMFQWLPVLLIFLSGALTMRAWSEERRAGTLESLLTSPVNPLHLVLGKFLAALALVCVALILTLPLPITVSFIGPLDWGPVIGGYVATIFLAAAYVAVGVYMSARTDNPIVALILTAAVCGILYLLGSPAVTSLFGRHVGEILGLVGSGSRFESITRGVLDLRDLYYYLSIVGVFLSLNLFALERLRWAGNPRTRRHRRSAWLAGLMAANFVAANLWLAPITWARVDITQGHIYSLSPATKGYLAQLREPLLIRGYFSAKTHPLLAPLVPRIKDMLEEYAVAGKGRVRVEFVDPQEDPAVEEAAASKYGIRPVPFQMANKYQASVVNSYFNILVAYGGEYQTLSYRDLIEVKVRGERDLDVLLKNPEYEITRSIRKVVSAYRSGGNPFDTLTKPVAFVGYISPDARLPKDLVQARAELADVLKDLEKQAGEKLAVSFSDPDANGGAVAKSLRTNYGLSPQIASLLDPQPFWFYMVLQGNGETVQVPLPAELSKDSLKRALTAGVRRLAPGFLKTIAVVSPRGAAANDKSYSHLIDALSQNANVREPDLSDGRVPEEADLLMVMAPDNLSRKQLFAIDQFLMEGGSVVLATSPFDVHMTDTLSANRHKSGLEDWLKSQGIAIEDDMVLDPQDASLPVPVERHIGPIPVREIQLLPYPHFPDIRGSGLNADNPITSALGQVTLNWASPIAVDRTKNQGRRVIELLHSSPQSWTSASLDIVPDYRTYPASGFAPPGQRAARLLGVVVEGRFDSYFKGQQSPLAQPATAAAVPAGGKAPEKPKPESATSPASVIERSPDSARIILIPSNTFATDAVLNLASEGIGTLYTRPLALLQNAIDWSLEDRSLLAIRTRGQFARTLLPMAPSARMFWEYLNYGLALAGVFAVWLWRRRVRHGRNARYQAMLAQA